MAGLPLKFAPGEQWAYNNTGYVLLGMILQKVSGKSWSEFLDERVFRPIQMTATRVNDCTALIPHRAGSYRWENRALRNGDTQSPAWTDAAGALVSTVLDMAKWDAALYTEQLLRSSSMEQMWTPARINSGQALDYGLGWQLWSSCDRRVIGHIGGGVPGWSSSFSRFVEDGLTVILLVNRDSLPKVYSGTLAHEVAAYYLR